MEEIHLDTLRANRERIQLAINMQDSMKKFVKIFQEGCIVVLKRLELESEVSEMKRSLDDTGDELRAAEALVEKGIFLIVFSASYFSPILLLKSFKRDSCSRL